MTRTWRGEIYRCPKVGWSVRPTIAHYMDVNRSIHVPFHRDLVWRNRKGEATVVGRMKLSTAGWPRPCLGWTNTNNSSNTNTNSRFLTNTDSRFRTNTDSRFLTNTNSRSFTNTNGRSLQILTADSSQILTVDFLELLTADFSEIHFNGRFHIWAFGYDTNQASCCLFGLRSLLPKKTSATVWYHLPPIATTNHYNSR